MQGVVIQGMSAMQTTIMRRVFMSYVLSYTQQSLLWYGLVLGGSISLFGRFTHVASIVDNVLATPLGQVPNYMARSFLGAIMRGELGTVLVVLTIASLSAVVVYKLSKVRLSIQSVQMV